MKQGKNLGGFHVWVLFINKLANRQIKKKEKQIGKAAAIKLQSIWHLHTFSLNRFDLNVDMCEVIFL